MKVKDDVEEETEEEETKEEEPKGILLDDYFNKNKANKQERINESKAKITSDQLMKELQENKASLLESRNTREIDERRQGKKKAVRIDEDHHLADTNGQYGELLRK